MPAKQPHEDSLKMTPQERMQAIQKLIDLAKQCPSTSHESATAK